MSELADQSPTVKSVNGGGREVEGLCVLFYVGGNQGRKGGKSQRS